MVMSEQLKCTYGDEERAATAALGEDTESSLSEKIRELFDLLGDPLLSAEDVAALLVTPKTAEAQDAMADLVAEGYLEYSDNTQRAFDPAGVRLYRLADREYERLVLTALQAEVGDNGTRYQFSCDGRLIRAVAQIDRLDAIEGKGQQREEIRKHVAEIADGIRSGTHIPNSILLVLLEDKTALEEALEEAGEDLEDIPASWTRVRPVSKWITATTPGEAASEAQRVRLVQIDFPFRRAAFDDEKTALLVDGQQRTAALSLVNVDEYPVVDLAVNLVIAEDDEAKEIFGVANNARPIPRDFKLALTASMSDAGGFLHEERTRALAARTLALSDTESPFYHLVKYPGLKGITPAPPVVYNSLFQVVREFEGTDLPGVDDPVSLAESVKRAFTLVKEAWADDWGKRPQESKLMHGVGLRSMAAILVWRLESRVPAGSAEITSDIWAEIESLLKAMTARVEWSALSAANGTSDAQEFYEKQVAERQNTNTDVARLTKMLKKVVGQIERSGELTK